MPVRLRAKSRTSKKYKDLYATYPGVFITFTGIGMLLSYFIYAQNKMTNGNEDKTTERRIANDFEEISFSQFEIDKHIFFPSIEINFLANNEEV